MDQEGRHQVWEGYIISFIYNYGGGVTLIYHPPPHNTMPYKTGSWGPQAKERSKKRREYFREYKKNNPQTPEYKREYQRKYREKHPQKQIGIGVPTSLVIEVVKRANGLCELCGAEGGLIHHKDGIHENSILINLQFLCRGCHNVVHVRNKRKEV